MDSELVSIDHCKNSVQMHSGMAVRDVDADHRVIRGTPEQGARNVFYCIGRGAL